MPYLKRYLVFHMPQYYPSGGWDDLTGMTDSKEEAFDLARSEPYIAYTIIDTQAESEEDLYLILPEDEARL